MHFYNEKNPCSFLNEDIIKVKELQSNKILASTVLNKLYFFDIENNKSFYKEFITIDFDIKNFDFDFLKYNDKFYVFIENRYIENEVLKIKRECYMIDEENEQFSLVTSKVLEEDNYQNSFLNSFIFNQNNVFYFFDYQINTSLFNDFTFGVYPNVTKTKLNDFEMNNFILNISSYKVMHNAFFDDLFSINLNNILGKNEFDSSKQTIFKFDEILKNLYFQFEDQKLICFYLFSINRKYYSKDFISSNNIVNKIYQISFVLNLNNDIFSFKNYPNIFDYSDSEILPKTFIFDHLEENFLLEKNISLKLINDNELFLLNKERKISFVFNDSSFYSHNQIDYYEERDFDLLPLFDFTKYFEDSIDEEKHFDYIALNKYPLNITYDYFLKDGFFDSKTNYINNYNNKIYKNSSLKSSYYYFYNIKKILIEEKKLNLDNIESVSGNPMFFSSYNGIKNIVFYNGFKTVLEETNYISTINQTFDNGFLKLYLGCFTDEDSYLFFNDSFIFSITRLTCKILNFKGLESNTGNVVLDYLENNILDKSFFIKEVFFTDSENYYCLFNDNSIFFCKENDDFLYYKKDLSFYITNSVLFDNLENLKVNNVLKTKNSFYLFLNNIDNNFLFSLVDFEKKASDFTTFMNPISFEKKNNKLVVNFEQENDKTPICIINCDVVSVASDYPVSSIFPSYKKNNIINYYSDELNNVFVFKEFINSIEIFDFENNDLFKLGNRYTFSIKHKLLDGRIKTFNETFYLDLKPVYDLEINGGGFTSPNFKFKTDVNNYNFSFSLFVFDAATKERIYDCGYYFDNIYDISEDLINTNLENRIISFNLVGLTPNKTYILIICPFSRILAESYKIKNESYDYIKNNVINTELSFTTSKVPVLTLNNIKRNDQSISITLDNFLTDEFCDLVYTFIQKEKVWNGIDYKAFTDDYVFTVNNDGSYLSDKDSYLKTKNNFIELNNINNNNEVILLFNFLDNFKNSNLLFNETLEPDDPLYLPINYNYSFLKTDIIPKGLSMFLDDETKINYADFYNPKVEIKINYDSVNFFIPKVNYDQQIILKDESAIRIKFEEETIIGFKVHLFNSDSEIVPENIESDFDGYKVYEINKSSDLKTIFSFEDFLPNTTYNYFIEPLFDSSTLSNDFNQMLYDNLKVSTNSFTTYKEIEFLSSEYVVKNVSSDSFVITLPALSIVQEKLTDGDVNKINQLSFFVNFFNNDNEYLFSKSFNLEDSGFDVLVGVLNSNTTYKITLSLNAQLNERIYAEGNATTVTTLEDTNSPIIYAPAFNTNQITAEEFVLFQFDLNDSIFAASSPPTKFVLIGQEDEVFEFDFSGNLFLPDLKLNDGINNFTYYVEDASQNKSKVYKISFLKESSKEYIFPSVIYSNAFFGTNRDGYFSNAKETNRIIKLNDNFAFNKISYKIIKDGKEISDFNKTSFKGDPIDELYIFIDHFDTKLNDDEYFVEFLVYDNNNVSFSLKQSLLEIKTEIKAPRIYILSE